MREIGYAMIFVGGMIVGYCLHAPPQTRLLKGENNATVTKIDRTCE